MNEKFSLKWNDYHSNWTKSLSELRNDKESVDVTMISEDKVKFMAHKILLSSCSKTFKFILKGNFHAHPHPLLYLSGVSSVNLGFILNFIYFGEVNLFQDQLDNFLESARKLEIEGIQEDYADQGAMWQSAQKHVIQEQNIEHIKEHNEVRGVPAVLENTALKTNNYSKGYVYPFQNREETSSNYVAKVDGVSMTDEEIEMKKNDLYQKLGDIWRCLVCAYTSLRMDSLKKHAETHLDGLCYTCTLCNRDYR